MYNLSNFSPNISTQMNKNIQHQMNQDLNQLSNQDFYETLSHYEPLCSCSPNHSQYLSTVDTDKQKPQKYVIFLLNQGWWKSFICILAMNGLYLLTYLKFVLDTRAKYVQNHDSSQPVIVQYTKSQNYNTMIILCIASLALIDISYFFTQFLNPGIRNLAQIPDEEFRQAKKVQFCQKCNQYRTQKFTHCSQCEVCIWNYDHHCGFFGKCVGGRAQYWAFMLFMASVTAGFLILLGCVTVELGAMA